MRLHHLRAEAFGPFTDAVDVDFDALSEGGVFLLSGPTGAGKTSVLDAVCFALYGDVPGDRALAKRLRSDHAAPGAAPRVTLEFTVRERRLRIVRSPAWERPKRRGVGTTKQPATVSVSEQTDGAWSVLSTRADETGHLVTELVALTLAQFCQVAMLPQNRFQAFLRAKADERHRLLQQLFRTGRFAQVEAWLKEHRAELRRASREHGHVVADLVSRISETSGRAAPPDDPHRLRSWLDHCADHSASALTLATLTAAISHRSHGEVRSRHESALARHRIHQRLVTAQAEQERLEASAGRLHQLRDDLQRSDAARPLVELSHRQRRARATLDELIRARHDLADRIEAMSPSPPTERSWHDAATDDVRARHRRAIADASAAQELVPAAHRLESLVDELRGHETAVGQLTRRLDDLELVREVARSAADTLRARDELRHRTSAARQLVNLTRRLQEAREEHLVTVTQTQQAKETWLAVREARLDGMAAEIAGALAVGCSCPVCGSADHPHPARPAPGAPDAAAERRSRALVDNAEIAQLAASEVVRDLQTQIAVTEQAAGGHLDDLVAQLNAREQQWGRLASRASAAGFTLDHPDDLEALVAQEIASVTERRTTMRTRLATLSEERDRLEHLVQSALDASGFTTPDELATHRQMLCDAVQEFGELGVRIDAATEAVQGVSEELDTALERAPFDTLDEALHAALDPDRAQAIETQVQSAAADLMRVAAILADPEIAAERECGLPLPDLGSLASRRSAAEACAERAAGQLTTAQSRASRTRELITECRSELEIWEPLRRDLGIAERLTALVDGRSPDNAWQMRLSAYVVAFRLGQVVRAANTRLGRMTDGRYALEHVSTLAAGDPRGGLGLAVRDDWSGESRDPATLSGGETFVVSLALALGLADVIAAEAGGPDLATLFVDEGFGSLDTETLDAVLDTIDDLREGGRVIGVVSHVAEMQHRIPTQLRIHKSPTGSTVSLRSAAGDPVGSPHGAG